MDILLERYELQSKPHIDLLCTRDLCVLIDVPKAQRWELRGLLQFKDSGMEDALNSIGVVISCLLRSICALYIWVDMEGKRTGNAYTCACRLRKCSYERGVDKSHL